MTINRQFFIAGVKFHPGAAETIRTLEEGDLLELEMEPSNQYDSNAVSIYHGDTLLGYVPKTMSSEISAAMEIEELECKVIMVDPNAKTWEMCKVEIKTVDEEDLDEIDEEDLEDDDYSEDEEPEFDDTPDYLKD